MTQVEVANNVIEENVKIERGLVLSAKYCGVDHLYVVVPHHQNFYNGDNKFVLTCITDEFRNWNSFGMTGGEVRKWMKDCEAKIVKKLTITAE